MLYYYIINKGKNNRGEVLAAFTKDAIKLSFMKLLNNKPLNKITVKDIVEDCHINRNSFYYHYNDIPSLLEEILNEQADALLKKSQPDTIYDCLLEAVDFALSNKKAMLHIFNSANSQMLYQYLGRVSEHTVAKFIEQYASDTNSNISSKDKEVIIMYYKSLLIGFVIDWVSNDMKFDLRGNIGRMCKLFEGSTENAFLRGESNESDDVEQ